MRKHSNISSSSNTNGSLQLTQQTISNDAFLVGGSDVAFRKMIYDLGHMKTLLEESRTRIAASLGLTSPQYNILMSLSEKQGDKGATVKEIAEYLHVSGPFITSQVQRLENKGLVVRQKNPDDGRSVLLKLSPEGVKLRAQLLPRLREFNNLLFGKIPREDFEGLCRSIIKVIDNWEEAETYLSRTGW
ncbi:MAG: MarR family transcriptional regulator [Sneathiellales bacterium]|nr:MarR family transcriptional regulator [Sneathiellales bacterium]